MFNNISSILKPNITPAFNGVHNISSKPFFTSDFATNTLTDNFSSNKLFNTTRENLITIAKSNPQIMNILKEYNIKLNPNIEELNKLKKGHLLDTRILTAKIYSKLPPELKSEVNLSELQEAAMLHDYGKVLIPKEILAKNGTLNSNEYAIMQQHTELGYELLKSQGVNKNILNMIRYHHQNLKHNGYPNLEENQDINLGTQIISLADKYSALLESRSYKSKLSKEEALKIISEDVQNGLISEELFNTLKQVL